MNRDPLRPPETDGDWYDPSDWEDPEDPISPARGCAVGFLLGFVCAAIVAALYLATRSAS